MTICGDLQEAEREMGSMEDTFMKETARCAAVLQASLPMPVEAVPGASREMACNAEGLMDVWEKSQFVVRLLGTIVELGATDRLPARRALPDLYDVEDNVDAAFAHVWLALALALNHQPDREEEVTGFFGDLVAMERDYFPHESEGLPARWPTDFQSQYRLARNYTLLEDPLAGHWRTGISDLSGYTENLYAVFERHYIFPRDKDEDYLRYVQLFCRLTLGFAGHCLDYCRAMVALTGEEVVEDDTGRNNVAAVILHARSIATYGLKVNYRRWVDDMENRC